MAQQTHSPKQVSGKLRFTMKRKIADTIQGMLFLATDTQTKKQVAVKETWKRLVKRRQSRDGTAVSEDFLKEMKIISHLSKLRNPHPGKRQPQKIKYNPTRQRPL